MVTLKNLRSELFAQLRFLPYSSKAAILSAQLASCGMVFCGILMNALSKPVLAASEIGLIGLSSLARPVNACFDLKV